MNFKKTMMIPSVAVLSLAGFALSQVPAFAQSEPPLKTHMSKRYHTGMHRTLTVRKTAPAPVVAAKTAPGPGPITAVTGAASTVVGLPFQALGQVFPAPGPRKGGVTAQRYAGAGKESTSIDEGFAAPVPVDMSGPIFVVENGDPTVSPMTIIGAPIAVAGELAQTPFKIIGATGL